MFEIGNSLREARERQGIDFAQAELATKVRGKYLRALEEERFELLPAETYVKGFLRTYAEYLGLDGQLYVDEFNSRFVVGDEREPRSRRSQVRPRRSRRLETGVVLVALALIVALTVVVISAWKAGGSGPKKAASTPPVAKTTIPLLTLLPHGGAAHVVVRRTSSQGAIAFDGTIQRNGEPIAIRGTRLWVRIDEPEHVSLIIDGHARALTGLRARTLVITRAGWRPA